MNLLITKTLSETEEEKSWIYRDLKDSFLWVIYTFTLIIATRVFHDWVNGYPQWANQPAASLAVTLW